jgi:hypothetical protein
MHNISFSRLISSHLGERIGEQEEKNSQLSCTVANNKDKKQCIVISQHLSVSNLAPKTGCN